jgi:hypothetical protein
MIPYEVDPSLHTAEPEPQQLDDGFSPPPHEPGAEGSTPAQPAASAGMLGEKSPF